MAVRRRRYDFEKYARVRFAGSKWAEVDEGPPRDGEAVLVVRESGIYNAVVIATTEAGAMTVEIGDPDPHALVGTAEVAELLDVERPRIGRWVSKGQMPRPLAITRASPIWWRVTIEAMRDAVESRKKRVAA